MHVRVLPLIMNTCCLALISEKKNVTKGNEKGESQRCRDIRKSSAAGQGLQKCSNEECSIENHSRKSAGAIRRIHYLLNWVPQKWFDWQHDTKHAKSEDWWTDNKNQRTVSRSSITGSFSSCSSMTQSAPSSAAAPAFSFKPIENADVSVSENHLEGSVAFPSDDLISEKRDL